MDHGIDLDKIPMLLDRILDVIVYCLDFNLTHNVYAM